jgi:hypothetical protein
LINDSCRSGLFIDQKTRFGAFFVYFLDKKGDLPEGGRSGIQVLVAENMDEWVYLVFGSYIIEIYAIL